jgi:heptosyltransferase II
MSDVGRLVIRAPNWLGDAVLALPAMAAVRRALPDAHITVAALPSIAPMFEEDTSAGQDGLIVLPDARRERQALAAGSFDAALLLPNSFRTALSAGRAGIPRRWGYAAGFRRLLLTTAAARPRQRIHQSEYYLELVRRIGYAAGATPPRVVVRPPTQARADALLAQHGVAPGACAIGFAPGAAYGHAKRWPPARVADVVVRLARERRAACLLVGAAADRDAGREIESSLPPDVRAVNLIGRTDLRVLCGVIARCAAFVSNDSGAMHLAGAIGAPLVAIFGPTDDRVTAPIAATPVDVLTHAVFCRPCMLRDCPIDHRCMKGITAEAVLDAVSRRLPGVQAAR